MANNIYGWASNGAPQPELNTGVANVDTAPNQLPAHNPHGVNNSPEVDQVHDIPSTSGHGLLDSRRDLQGRSPHAANTPSISSNSGGVTGSW